MSLVNTHVWLVCCAVAVLLPLSCCCCCLQVRFYLHMPSSVFACIVVALTTLWSYSSSSSGSQGLWGLLQHLLLGWAAPSMLIYLWELDYRLRYVDGLEQQQSSKGAKQSKCKDV